jgi:hypothetical protein
VEDYAILFCFSDRRPQKRRLKTNNAQSNFTTNLTCPRNNALLDTGADQSLAPDPHSATLWTSGGKNNGMFDCPRVGSMFDEPKLSS